MTNKGLARRFPTILSNPYAASPLDEMFQLMDAMSALRPTLINEAWLSPTPKATDLSKDGEAFSVWTKGDYPKLNIYAEYSPSSEQSPTPEMKALVIEAAVPGCAEDQVAVNILGGEVTIETNIHTASVDYKAEREKRDATRHYFVKEVPERYSKMSVGVTGSFDYDAATATFVGAGMLRIVIPAKPIEREKPKNLLGATKEPVSKVKTGKK